MGNDPFSESKTASRNEAARSRCIIARVDSAPDHTIGDENLHTLTVIPLDREDDRTPVEAQMSVAAYGDLNIPIEDNYVLVERQANNVFLVRGVIYVEDIDDNWDYTAGERRLGHALSDAHVYLDQDGFARLEADDTSGIHTNTDEVSMDNPTGTSLVCKGPDIFNQPNGGNVYGVGEPHMGVLESDPSQNPTETSPYYEYVDLGFQPRYITFQNQLNLQSAFNEPYYTADATETYQTAAMAVSTGVCALTPLEYQTGFDDTTLSDTSTTAERVEGEPYSSTQLNNPTQLVQSRAWFNDNPTDYRSLFGDDQVVRLISVSDAAASEAHRVEARVNYIDSTGFEMEWFADTSDTSSSNPNWNTDHAVPIQYTAYD